MILLMMMGISSSKTPMYILMVAITITLMLAAKIFYTTLNYWASILIILIFITGMLVLFMYVASLVPNLKSDTKFNLYSVTISMLMATLLMSLNLKSSLSNLTVGSNFSINLISALAITSTICSLILVPPKMITTPMKGMKTSK